MGITVQAFDRKPNWEVSKRGAIFSFLLLCDEGKQGEGRGKEGKGRGNTVREIKLCYTIHNYFFLSFLSIEIKRLIYAMKYRPIFLFFLSIQTKNETIIIHKYPFICFFLLLFLVIHISSVFFSY